MISADILHRINQRLQQITGVYDQLFGGMNIILCGDFRQLPPVNATPVFKMPRNVFAGVVLWQSLNYFPLLRVVRQFDETFSSILTKIGNGETLTDDENILIEGRFRTVEWCNENLPNAVRLYHRNIDVDAYNRTAIVDPVRCVTRDRFFGYTTVTEKNECRRKLHKMSVAEYDGLPYMIALATDYPYMITINIDVEDGLVNGAIGVLKYIETLEDEDCNVDDDEPQPSTSGGSDTIEHIVNIRLKPNILSRDWTPVNKRTINISLSKTVKCKRQQFPVVSACAITIHKSQGGTFDEIVFKYDSGQQHQLVYVALSRVTTIEGLYMVNDKNDFRFHHRRRGSNAPHMKEIRTEYQRLEQHRLDTITSRAHLFCTSPDTV
ncbi:ATP-dependent DNA helicase pfh1-like [Ooceraea biroi]|uniref:ATP-dependent DNA helicase pfh1-like n=1 Tax=Ooceraea biroi TaxID=2015173 RepID=UPI000F076680|nr:ATP-dependent DNA helicase pfh1-like [Ooceraea biroi]